MEDTFHLYKSGFNPEKLIYLSEQQLAALKKVLLEMLSDFIETADKYKISYTLSGGSVLGAVRHKGFIPWDDDIDINMPRAAFDRFSEVFDEELGEKYILCTPSETKGHGILCVQMKKRGTVCRSFNELCKPEELCGIAIDIFILENTYENSILRRLHGYGVLAIGYLTTCKKTSQDYPSLQRYLEPNSPAEEGFRRKARIGSLLGWISLDRLTKWGSKWYSLCKNNNSIYVTIPSGRKHYFGEMQTREDLCDPIDATFEGMPVKIPKGYDVYLKSLYGEDYMQLPPIEDRESHPLMELDF